MEAKPTVAVPGELSPFGSWLIGSGPALRQEGLNKLPLDILVVDDSAAIRKILLRVLAQTDLPIGKVIEAGDGVEALKALESTKVGLILSDINMPNMDGLQLLTKLQANPNWNQLPVIMITTEGSQAKVLEAVQLGARGYVRKPFTAEQIKEKVLSCVHGELSQGS